MYDIRKWQYVFKLDSTKEISDENLEALRMSDTDAIMIGGTDDVTEDNVIHLMSRARRCPLPLVLEVSDLDNVMPGFDFYFIPPILNSNDVTYHNGSLHRASKQYGHMINFEEVMLEGYAVPNPDSKVAKLTQSNTQLDVEGIEAYAQLVEEMYKLSTLYLGYNGIYEDKNIVKATSQMLTHTQSFYGGGISSLTEAEETKNYADTITVGNIIYSDIKEVSKTVKIKKELK